MNIDQHKNNFIVANKQNSVAFSMNKPNYFKKSGHELQGYNS